MGRRGGTREAVREPTSEDWCAMYVAMRLFQQIVLHGNGRRTLIRFAEAILKAEAQRGTAP